LCRLRLVFGPGTAHSRPGRNLPEPWTGSPATRPNGSGTGRRPDRTVGPSRVASGASSGETGGGQRAPRLGQIAAPGPSVGLFGGTTRLCSGRAPGTLPAVDGRGRHHRQAPPSQRGGTALRRFNAVFTPVSFRSHLILDHVPVA
jgi:hypothetical protein